MHLLRQTRWPAVMAFIRWPLILVGSGIVMLVYRVPNITAGLLVAVEWASFTVTVVNLITLGLLLWRAQSDAFRLRDMIGFRRERLWRDLGQGLLLSIGLYALLALGIMVTALLVQFLTGKTLFEQFAPPMDAAGTGAMPPWLAVISALAFSILNAPIEELHYRGYAQPRLIGMTGAVWAGILVTALGFGLQHMAFAYTVYAMPVFVVGFLFWGIGAGFVVHRQGRLMPVLVAHLISNLFFGIGPLLYYVL